ncbi:siderophore-interacting protein [Massilia sp. H-1]|nr:siderophore-interacting protein [Massilia sp. H-1]
MAGPGGPPRFVPGAACYLLFGDPSALAVLASVLAQLPHNARGHVLVEIAGSDQMQTLPRPDGITLHWLIRGSEMAWRQHPAGGRGARAALAARHRLGHAGGRKPKQVVSCCEHLLHERGIPPEAMYAVPYWKERHTEEAYHAERHRIMDRFEGVADAV